MGQLGFEVFSILLLLKEAHVGECLELAPHFGTSDIIPTLTSLGLLALGWCTSCLLLHNELLQAEWLTPVHCFTDFVGHESGHGLAGFSAQGLTRLHSSCRLGLGSQLRLGWSSKFIWWLAEFISLQL